MIYIDTYEQEIQVITYDTGDVIVTTVDPSASNTAIQFQDEGVNLGTTGTVNTVDFTGAGVTASRSGDKVTVAISSGGSSTPSINVEGGTERKISAMTAITASNVADGDLFTLVDVSDTTDAATGTNKSITAAQLKDVSRYRVLFCRTTSVAVSGSASETLLDSFLITPDMINPNGILEMIFRVTKSGTVANLTLRVRIGTSNDLTGTQVSTYTTGAASTTYISHERSLVFKGTKASQEIITATFNTFTDVNQVATTIQAFTIDFTVNQYIVLSCSGDNTTITCRNSLITMIS